MRSLILTVFFNFFTSIFNQSKIRDKTLLPFQIDDLNGGFAVIKGTLRLDGDKLHFEFYKSDDIIEAFKSDLKTVRVPLKDVIQIDFKKKLFGVRLTIRAKSEGVFAELEGTDIGERKLKIKKKYAAEAHEISSRSNLFISEERLRELGED